MLNAFSEIPVIDIAALSGTDDTARLHTARQLGDAARHVGFLYVTGHGVPPALYADLQDAARRFFALPVAEKMQVYIGRSSNHRGYVPEGEEGAEGSNDLKEAFDLSLELPPDDPDYLAGNPLLGPNQWPRLGHFAGPVRAYYDATFAVGRALMSGFAQAMNEPPSAFEHVLRKPPSQLRLVHYPYDPDAHDRPGIGAHTDFECFTLLRATAPGLEVMNSAGQWIDVPPRADAYVVNIGDMLELWTNGEFIATSHRVRRVREERYSFPLFFNVDYHTRVAPLPRFVTPANPPRSALLAGEHLFAQTVHFFRYQRERLKRGEIALPAGALDPNSFGQQAIHAQPARAGTAGPSQPAGSP